jgi:hypothetical protein
VRLKTPWLCESVAYGVYGAIAGPVMRQARYCRVNVSHFENLTLALAAIRAVNRTAIGSQDDMVRAAECDRGCALHPRQRTRAEQGEDGDSYSHKGDKPS